VVSTAYASKLIWGDNKLVLSSLQNEFAGKVDLIYIDPPFDVGANFSIRVKVGDEEVTKKPSMIEEKAYRDTWGRGTDSYLQMLYERITLMRDLLSDKGSIYVHLDWHVGHYAKVLLDEVFGRENFINEIVWYYWNKFQMMGMGGFARNHDTIFWYVKNRERYHYNPQTQPLDRPKKLKRIKWDKEKGKIQNVKDESGHVVYDTYTEEKVDDVWDIPYIGTTAGERIGFDTQKPEKVLERIVSASSEPGDLVADFFCGSGTTGAVAERLGRRWLMCDIGRFGIHTSRKRLMELQRNLKLENKDFFPFEILNLGKYERQHWQTMVVNGGHKGNRSKKINQYLKFIIELYRGNIVSGFSHIHGKLNNNFIHVGVVDAPITMNELRETVEECKNNKFSALDVLGWEWEMGLNEEAIKWAKSQGVRLRLLQIPREVMDKRAVESGDVKFFELDYVQVDVEKKGMEAKVTLKDFAIPSEELIPSELREKITNWADYIDYWSVDWDYQNLKSADGEPIFQNDWQTFRTKRNPKLELETPQHKYNQKGQYQILVKVIDIFGNDTSKVIEVKI